MNKLQEIAKKYEAFDSKYRELNIKLFAKDIPNFYTNVVVNKCAGLRFSQVDKLDANKAIAKACGDLAQVKRKAVNLFRIEGTPQYAQEAEKFVRENMLPEIAFSTPSATSSQSSEPSEGAKLLKRIQELSGRSNNHCSTHSLLVENTADRVFTDLAKDVNKAKPTVDAIIDAYYGDDCFPVREGSQKEIKDNKRL